MLDQSIIDEIETENLYEWLWINRMLYDNEDIMIPAYEDVDIREIMNNVQFLGT